MRRFPEFDIGKRHHRVGVRVCAICDVDYHQRQDHLLNPNLIQISEPLNEVRGRIDMCSPLSGVAVLVGEEPTARSKPFIVVIKDGRR